MSTPRYPAAIRDSIAHLAQNDFTETELVAALAEAERFAPRGRFKSAIARLEAAHVAKVEVTAPVAALLHPERPSWFNASAFSLDPILIVGASAYVREGYSHADLCCLLVIRTAKRLTRAGTVSRMKARLAADPKAKALNDAKRRLDSTRRRLSAALEELAQLRPVAASPEPVTSWPAERRLKELEPRVERLKATLAEQTAAVAALSHSELTPPN